MFRRSVRALLPLLAVLSGCVASASPPPCPFSGTPEYSASAGCLAVIHSRILVVEFPGGAVSPPGGKSLEGESAQCAAHRETWEETGLDLMPRQRLAVFDTGFYLYYCEIHARSGDIDPASLFEIERGYWLPLAEFNRVRWRYVGQGEQLRRLLSP